MQHKIDKLLKNTNYQNSKKKQKFCIALSQFKTLSFVPKLSLKENSDTNSFFSKFY